MKLDPLDELIALGHGDKRSLDCFLIVTPKRKYSQDELKQGCLKAQALFPKTNSYPVILSQSKSLDEFINSTLPSHFHLEITSLDNGEMALKMSHLLGDGVSLLLFLNAVFGGEVSSESLKYKNYPPKKDTPFRKIFNSKVWPQKVKQIGYKRHFLRCTLQHDKIPNGQNLNDILILALLKSLPFEHKAIWIPLNVRKRFFEGFGNGLSRMRVYPAKSGNNKIQLDHIKKQKLEAKSSGEIALPPLDLDLSNPVKKMLFLAWVKRPWADWGSIGFSHMLDKGTFSELENIWGITNIMPNHQASLFAFTRETETHLTLTYDPAGVSDLQATHLMNEFDRQTKEIIRDLLS